MTKMGSYLPSIYAPDGLDQPPPSSGSTRDAMDQEEVSQITDLVLQARQEGYASDQYRSINSYNLNQYEPTDAADDTIFLVVDTNFIISHLQILDELRSLHVFYHDIFQIIIPQQVIQELDLLKMASSAGKTSKQARSAIDWCYKFLHDRDAVVRGQMLSERLDREALKDDAILDCCLFLQKNHTKNLVILMTNDKNLCIKALTNSILTISFRPSMDAKLIANTIVKENKLKLSDRHTDANLMDVDESTYPVSDGDLMTLDDEYYDYEQETNMTSARNSSKGDDVIRVAHDISINEASLKIFTQVEMLALEAIDFVIKAEFEEDYELVGYKPEEMASLRDCCHVLKRFSFSAFGDYFKKGRFSPLRYLESRRSIEQVCEAPLTTNDLKEFREFWVEVLTSLYKDRDITLVDSLTKIFNSWDEMIYNSSN